MRTDSYVFPGHSKAEIMYKCNKKMQNLYGVSKPKCNAPSNGGLGLPVS